MRPILEAGAERLDEEAAKAGAIDVEFARDGLAAFQPDAGDAGGAFLDIDDLALDPTHAPRFGVAAQKPGVEAGVEVKGVGRGGEAGAGGEAAAEPILPRGDGVEAIGAEFVRDAERAGAAPIMVKGDEAEVAADGAEGVHVAVAVAAPSLELDAELERPLAGAEEFVLVYAQ